MNKPAQAHSPQHAQQPTARFMWSHPVHILSFGFGTGLSPIAPGTIGTLFSWLSFVVLNHYLTPGQWIFLIFVGFVLGVGATGYTAKKLGCADPSAANLDEIIAFWLVMLFVMPATFATQLAAFLLFRFFDIVKPPPICTAERHFSGGVGIMFDDLVAAFFTLLVIALWTRITSFIN
jgi:phosphatidylglycerophosphatase A